MKHEEYSTEYHCTIYLSIIVCTVIYQEMKNISDFTSNVC